MNLHNDFIAIVSISDSVEKIVWERKAEEHALGPIHQNQKSTVKEKAKGLS